MMAGEKSTTPELDRLRAEVAGDVPKPEATAPAQPGGAKRADKGKHQRGGAQGNQPRGRPRTGARVAAVQALYQSEHTGEAAEPVIAQFLRHRIGTASGAGGFEDGRVPEADAPLFSAIVRRAAKNGATLDGIISSHLDADWPLPKLDPVLRALLRAACAELWEAKAPPARVVINEYLDIAHGFFGGDEPRFANGVLDAMARALRAEEFAGLPPRRTGG